MSRQIRLRCVLVPSMVLASVIYAALPAKGQDILTGPQETVLGLDAVAVVVEPIPVAGRARGLHTDSLRQDVTALLEAAGLSVLSAEERTRTDRSPALYVQVTLFDDAERGMYAFHVRLALEQLVALRIVESGGAPLAYASTWDLGATGTVPIHQVRQIRQVVIDLTKQFIETVSP